MATINLRPWREELRLELKNQFMAIMGVVAGVGVVLVFVGHLMFVNAIDAQNGRNNFLSGEISQLDAKIKEIEKLKKRREELLERMRVIQELQGNRPIIVRIFDEIVQTIPDGVFYTSMDRKGNRVFLNGIAESNAKVSSLMRKLDASKWFKSPVLSGVKASPKDGETANKFNLRVDRTAPGEGAKAQSTGRRTK